jgi:hypothetical protein
MYRSLQEDRLGNPLNASFPYGASSLPLLNNKRQGAVANSAELFPSNGYRGWNFKELLRNKVRFT